MKKSGCAIAFLFVSLCLSMVANLILIALLGGKDAPTVAATRILRERHFEEEVVERGSVTSRIAEIPLDGIIARGQPGSLGSEMVGDFKRALRQAMEDDTVAAVVISVDSPGGEITASDVLYHALHQFRDHKPAIVYFNSIGASGAYYLACGATEIMCNATTFTGSIGVIISTLNYRDLFGKIGLESVVFKSGEFKDMLSGTRELTEAEKTYVQGLVMQSYSRFLSIVARARNLDEESLREGPADGRILSGSDAYEEKLVDGLGYIEDAYERARELAGSPDAQVVRYKRQVSFSDLFGFFGEAHSPRIKLEWPLGGVPLEPGKAYLLPAIFAVQ